MKRREIEDWIAGLREPGLPDEFEAKNLLGAFGIPVPEGLRLLPENGEAAGVIRPEALCPAAVKVCSPRILHKTEVGGVRLGVEAETIGRTISEFREKFPGDPLIVERGVKFQAPEFIIGGLQDPTFGPAVLAGAGGILTELYKDVSSRLCPCCREDALGMLGELTLSPVFRGFRNLVFDAGGLAELITAVSRLMAEGEGLIDQMDLNPVVFTKEGWIVLDAKVILV